MSLIFLLKNLLPSGLNHEEAYCSFSIDPYKDAMSLYTYMMETKV